MLKDEADRPDLIQVSPRFQLDRKTKKIISMKSGEGSFEFGDKTAARLIYQDRMQGWFFEPVYTLINNDHTVVAVHVVTPLIEALENYIRGKSSCGKSKQFFKARAKAIFSSLDDTAITLLYGGVRCGFAHEGFLKRDDDASYNIIISSQEGGSPIIYKHSEMTIYAGQYVDAIQAEFERYYS